MITIHVPMTTSNLGPGFDCFGLALKATNTYRFEAHRKMELVGFPSALMNTSNLAYQVYLDCFKRNNQPLYPVRITFTQGLPFCGGVGSSATAVIASLIAYHYFCGETFTKDQLIKEATYYEHHPDNVAAAILGGLTSCIMMPDRIISRSLPIHSKWRAYLLIPNMSIDTTVARGVLPKTITLEDAVFNMSRSILIPKALADGDEALLSSIIEDKFHEPYRFPMIPGAEEIISACRNNHIPCFLSGSGAAICVLSTEAMSLEFEGWEVKRFEVSERGLTYET